MSAWDDVIEHERQFRRKREICGPGMRQIFRLLRKMQEEENDRKRWIEDVKQRLGLVTTDDG